MNSELIRNQGCIKQSLAKNMQQLEINTTGNVMLQAYVLCPRINNSVKRHFICLNSASSGPLVSLLVSRGGISQCWQRADVASIVRAKVAVYSPALHHPVLLRCQPPRRHLRPSVTCRSAAGRQTILNGWHRSTGDVLSVGSRRAVDGDVTWRGCDWWLIDSHVLFLMLTVIRFEAVDVSTLISIAEIYM